MRANFFGSNVLVYIASGDAAKADQVEAAVATGGAISVQVLNEITNVAHREMQMSWADTHTFLDMLRGLLTVHPLTEAAHKGPAQAMTDLIAACLAHAETRSAEPLKAPQNCPAPLPGEPRDRDVDAQSQSRGR